MEALKSGNRSSDEEDDDQVYDEQEEQDDYDDLDDFVIADEGIFISILSFRC